MEKLITKSFRRLLDKGIHRGFITYEELGKSLGKRHYTQSNIETAFLHIFDNKVSLVEKRSDYRLSKKKDLSLSDNEKIKETEKSDDPIRMYLREMGGVELLSREGEIAIAKRIEAGKDYILNGLFQSPLTAKKVFEWKQQLDENKLLVREIIDIDSSYDEVDAGDESESPGEKKSKQKEKKKINYKLEQEDKNTTETEKSNDANDTKYQEYTEEDEFNLSLAAMEEEIRPQVISTINVICKEYAKLTKSHNNKLTCALSGEKFSRQKEKNHQKIQNNIIDKVKTLQLNASVLENLKLTYTYLFKN